MTQNRKWVARCIEQRAGASPNAKRSDTTTGIGCCGLSDFSDERACPGSGFVRHANMVAARALMTTRTFVSPELIKLVATTMNW